MSTISTQLADWFITHPAAAPFLFWLPILSVPIAAAFMAGYAAVVPVIVLAVCLSASWD